MAAFSSEKVTIAVRTREHHSKVFQIGFQKRDGSLFISFPYYRDAYGLLSHATLRASTGGPAQLDLTNGGNFTSHRVKYSHHPDGNVLFSQDGKILSRIRKKSVPLSTARGHVFTVQLQGLGDFDAVHPNEQQPTATARKTRINFQFDGEQPQAIKLVGNWYAESELVGSPGGSPPPWYLMERPDGSRVLGAAIRDPFLQHSEPCYLLLSCEPIPQLDKDRYSALTFVGGFDHPSIALDHEKDTSFLALSYPTSSYDRLVESVGSVDYIRAAQRVEPAR